MHMLRCVMRRYGRSNSCNDTYIQGTQIRDGAFRVVSVVELRRLVTPLRGYETVMGEDYGLTPTPTPTPTHRLTSASLGAGPSSRGAVARCGVPPVRGPRPQLHNCQGSRASTAYRPRSRYGGLGTDRAVRFGRLGPRVPDRAPKKDRHGCAGVSVQVPLGEKAAAEDARAFYVFRG